jgi:HlyD family secretion protein
MTTRPDLTALRISRDDEDEARLSLGKIAGWVLALAVLGAIGWAVYTRVVVPRRALAVESAVVKPSINVANPALLSATGYLVANKQSKITPKISGKVVKLNFDVGDKVRAGDVLAVLESTSLKAQLDEAQAAQSEAEREYTRQSNLWKQGVASRAGYDAAEAQVKAARARVDQIRINMHDMVVRAPFDGTIATKSTEVGEVISSVMIGQVAGTLPAGAICTIVDLNTLEVEADVNEGSIGQLHEGQPAEVTVDAFPGKKWRGVLRQIIPTADRAKATVKVKVKILDPGERLLPEMSATANFLNNERTDAELHEPPKLWVPKRAVADGKVAVIGADSRVQLRAVQTGAARESLVEVRSGLREGERIVTDGVERLKDGELIRTGEN